MVIEVSTRWDRYFLRMAREASSNSKCRSTTGKKGAVIAYGKRFVSAGYSGPPAGVLECYERVKYVGEHQNLEVHPGECPRAVLYHPNSSGKGLDLCVSCHAEVNAIIFAFRDLTDHTLYLWSPVMPCKMCAGYIINSGITRVVGITSLEYEKNPLTRAIQLFRDAHVQYDVYDGGLDDG